MKIELPVRPHAKQLEVIQSTARFNVIAAGRRWGKTEACKIRAMYRAPHKRVWWVMPTHSLGQPVFRDFEQRFRQLPGVYINKSERLIQFDTGGFLQVVSADSMLRSRGLDHCIMDEAAFIHPDIFPYVIRPMLLESKGSADFPSSTNGRNWYWDLFRLGNDPQEPDWQSWHFTSYDNPHIDPHELEDIKRHTPERVFSQEYEARFLEDGGSVFRNLQACIQPVPPETQHVVFGVDWGRANDFTVIVAIDLQTGHMLAMDRFNQIDWNMQRNRLVAMYEKYKPQHILAESNSIGEPNIEELNKQGLPVTGFTTTAQSKAEIVNSLALNLEQETIGILNDPVLLGELQAYTIEKLPSGNYRYCAPAGLHDDCVIALCLANWARLAKPRTYAATTSNYA